MNYISKIIKVLALIFFALLIQHNAFGQTVYNFTNAGATGDYEIKVEGAKGGGLGNKGSLNSGGGGGGSVQQKRTRGILSNRIQKRLERYL